MKVLLPYSHARHNYLVPKDSGGAWYKMKGGRLFSCATVVWRLATKSINHKVRTVKAEL
jgi:hypothetical protein